MKWDGSRKEGKEETRSPSAAEPHLGRLALAEVVAAVGGVAGVVGVLAAGLAVPHLRFEGRLGTGHVRRRRERPVLVVVAAAAAGLPLPRGPEGGGAAGGAGRHAVTFTHAGAGGNATAGKFVMNKP